MEDATLVALPSAQESTCPICGVSVAFRDFHKHMQAQHPAYVAAEHKHEADEKLALAKLFLPGIIVWFVAVLLVVFVYAANPTYLLTLIAVMFGLTAASALYAHRSTKADAAAVGSFARKCRICGVELDAQEMQQHLRTLHPQEMTYLREARAYAYGILAAIGLLMLFLWIELWPYLGSSGTRSLGHITGTGSLLAWTGAMVVWRRFVDTRHIAKVRRIWEHTHGATLPPEWTGT